MRNPISKEGAMTHVAPPEPEFSRIVSIESLADDELSREIEADAAERAALAKRFGLLALDSLRATVRLKRVRGQQIRVEGEFAADVVQACVVTLEPVPSHVADSFQVTFAPPSELSQAAELDLSPWAEDLPEPLEGDSIDIGETVSQFLALALDPYPRRQGVEFEAADYPGLEPARPREGPFAALATLRKNGQN